MTAYCSAPSRHATTGSRPVCDASLLETKPSAAELEVARDLFRPSAFGFVDALPTLRAAVDETKMAWTFATVLKTAAVCPCDPLMATVTGSSVSMLCPYDHWMETVTDSSVKTTCPCPCDPSTVTVSATATGFVTSTGCPPFHRHRCCLRHPHRRPGQCP